MEWESQFSTRSGFFKALAEDPYVETGAYAALLGLDPYSIINQENEDYLIRAAILRKALELRTQEIKALAALTGQSVALHLLSA